MLRVTFDDFKDSALKFDNQASIAFVIKEDGVWVKTGTRAKQLCYKESAKIAGLEKDKEISLCLEHSAVQKGVDARISSNGIENILTMIVDEDKKIASFEVEHILRIPAHDNVPEKVQELGISRRGPYKWETGFGATQTINLPTGISAEVREKATTDNTIDTISSKTLAEVFEMLGVLKQPIYITAEEREADKVDENGNVTAEGSVISPSKAFIGGRTYGEMNIPAFKRGVKVSYEMAAPVGKLLAKDTGNAECLARVDESKTRVFSVQTDSFYVSGVVEKVSAKSMQTANLMAVSGLDYDSYTFTCPKALIANIVEGTHVVKCDGDNLYVGEDTVKVNDLNSDGDLGEEIGKAFEKGVSVDCSQIRKLLSSEDEVSFAVAKLMQEDKLVCYVIRIGIPGGADNRPCWYLPAELKK